MNTGQNLTACERNNPSCQLRAFVDADAATILGWCKNKQAFRLWSADRYDSYPAEPADMLKQYQANDLYPLTLFEEGNIVGHLLLRYPSADRDVIRFGFIIVDDTLRGKGYGKKLLNLAIGYAREALHAKKITLGVFCNNQSAFACYRSVGFTVIDHDSYVIDGEEWKGYEMELVLN